VSMLLRVEEILFTGANDRANGSSIEYRFQLYGKVPWSELINPRWKISIIWKYSWPSTQAHASR